jgi:hypothetical protein
MEKHTGSPASSISGIKKEKKKPIPAGPPAGVSQQAPLELSRWRFVAIFLALMMSIFLFALGEFHLATFPRVDTDNIDQLIVATAIPKITVEFDSLTQLPWLGSGFL